MSNISSNSLFHFTPKKEYLINILNETFIPRYSIEEMRLSGKLRRSVFRSAIPMVCFCDISLSQINNHINMYGDYGIGMTKEWGIENKLNPIIYINTDSSISESVSGLAENIYQALDKHCSDITKSIFDEYNNLISFLKPYSGNFKRGAKTYANVRFYNEREWRYVPKINFDSNVKSSLDITDYSDPRKLKIENDKLKAFRLRFTPDDIKYIFVKNENEIHSMMRSLRGIKRRFNRSQIDVLLSKIITTEQIREDF